MTITSEKHHQLAAYPVVIEIPVLWGELDAYGHVNNTVYFRYFESARMAYLERCGVLESYERERNGIILYSTECRFRSALHHPDTVLVGARTVQIEDDRFVMGYGAASISQDRVVAEGSAEPGPRVRRARAPSRRIATALDVTGRMFPGQRGAPRGK